MTGYELSIEDLHQIALESGFDHARFCLEQSATQLGSAALSEQFAELARMEELAKQFVLCRSDQGDGGWSLHAPGSTDEDIATGDAPALVDGTAKWDDEADDWSRPDEADYIAAAARPSR